LVGWDAFFILNFGFHILDRVTWFHFQSDSLSGQSFHKNLYTTSQAKHKMKGRFLLNIVVAQGAAIFELFSCEDESLLSGGMPFLS